jgi:hypothetical protein
VCLTASVQISGETPNGGLCDGMTPAVECARRLPLVTNADHHRDATATSSSAKRRVIGQRVPPKHAAREAREPVVEPHEAALPTCGRRCGP